MSDAICESTRPIAPAKTHASPVLALVYDDGPAFDSLIWSMTRKLKARGLRLAGVVQQNQTRSDRRRCDMILEDLSTGLRAPISLDRGAGARGCHLDLGAFAVAVRRVEEALMQPVDLLVVNKFGKEETEGRGLRQAIARAVELGVPALLGVPRRNLDSVRAFCGDVTEEVPVNSSRFSLWMMAAIQEESLRHRNRESARLGKGRAGHSFSSEQCRT